LLQAPELVRAEATNIFRRLERAKLITTPEANAAQDDLMQLDIELFTFEPFAGRIGNCVTAAAFRHLTAAGDLKAVVGVAGSGKSTLLAAAREAFEAEGYTVKGAALSGIAAENLTIASGIESRTLASYEYAWKEGRDALTAKDVLMIDEAGVIGTKQLERMLAAADHARAKVILVGDPEQLQAIEAGAAFRGVLGQGGMVELTQVRRQTEAWAREATQALAGGRTAEAIQAYGERGALVAGDTHENARAKLLGLWAEDRRARPADSQLILAYTREDVRALNRAARELLQEEGKLGAAERIDTTRGAREMAAGERIMFLKNDKALGVKNGSIGTLERIQDGVRLDGASEQRIAVDVQPRCAGAVISRLGAPSYRTSRAGTP
jgi:Ti-type conjugative transfer relaxase TraA